MKVNLRLAYGSDRTVALLLEDLELVPGALAADSIRHHSLADLFRGVLLVRPVLVTKYW